MKLFKTIGWIAFGMLFAPKKGVELRADLVEYAKKYRPQIKKFISSLEEAWEKSQGNESDEIIANVETKLNALKVASVELDAASTKEIAYKALAKIGEISVKIGKEAIKSKNLQIIAKDLAVITVGAIDKTNDMYSKAKTVSTSLSDKVVVIGDSKKENKIKKEKPKTIKEV